MDVNDHFVLELHKAQTIEEVSKSIVELLQSHVYSKTVTINYCPYSGNDWPTYCNEETFIDTVQLYKKLGGNKIDLWYERCPTASGRQNVSRHSDQTSKEALLDSKFYEQILKPHDLLYGAVMNGFEQKNMLFYIGPMRTINEGDYTNEEIEFMLKVQPHIEMVVKRLFHAEEVMLGKEALGAMIQSIPLAAIIVNWELEMYLQNDMARVLCQDWGGNEKEEGNIVELPNDLKWALMALKKDIEIQLKAWKLELQPTLKRRIGFVNSSKRGIVASIDFLPSRSFSVSRGYFLIRLGKESLEQLKGCNPYEILSKLSGTERYIAELVAKGFSNQHIALELGKSPATIRNQLHSIFVKLGVERRQEIISLLR